MSAADQLNQMLANGRANDPYLSAGYPTSAESYYSGMNQYMQGIYDEYNTRGITPEEPNGWSQMLMNVAATNNSWSAEQAQKQMDFQERMSNTAHQREIADLKAAGLNPVLSAKLGGASTPIGAQGTVDTSITGSIVQLMDKMLTVESDNAKMQLTRELANMSGSGSGSGSEYGLLAALIDMIPGMSAKQSATLADSITGSNNKIKSNVEKAQQKIKITNPKTGETRKYNYLDELVSIVQKGLTGSNRLMTK